MNKNSEQIDASPTKRFFVELFTRDISLQDSILDLLDNCVDGIHRQQAGKLLKKNRYKGYFAKITISPTEFIIEDNCGGISKDILLNYALRLGSPDNKRDANIPTIGVYGIGMKRAIFKIGRECLILTRHKGKEFEVPISPAWLKSETDWKLPLIEKNKPSLKTDGTKIHVTKINDGINTLFKLKSGFIEELQGEIMKFFAFIIEEGFEVTLNGLNIKSKDFSLHSVQGFSQKHRQIAPYVFEGEFDGVEVIMAVGLNKPLSKGNDDPEEDTRGSQQSGWTVICNDRVVLRADQTILTGWGADGIPRFHNQFSSIAGVVIFKSNDALKLPLNTTKKGLNANSELYLQVLNQMKEGMRIFIDFTNKWKGRHDETNEFFAASKKITIAEISSIAGKTKLADVRKLKGYAQKAKYFRPELPQPPSEKIYHTIQFKKKISEVKTAGQFLFKGFDISELKASEIGEEAFNYVLKLAKRR